MYKLTFPGAGHNGHTLIAAILDSHAEVCIRNGYENYSIEEIIGALPKQWDGNKYSFRLTGQGGPKEPRVVGVTGRELDLPLEGKYIAVLRNPFDVIGSRYRRFKNRSKTPEQATFESYTTSLKQMEEVDSYYVYHEQFIKDPITWLSGLSDYLGLTFDPQWMKRGEKIVIPLAIPSRQYFPWTEEYTERVNGIIQNDTRLSPYKEIT